MIYLYNYEADAVVREDDSKKRYLKWLDKPSEEIPVTDECKEAWGISSFGYYNILRPITKEQYDTFGIEWKEITP